jgi:hypothetical protein
MYKFKKRVYYKPKNFPFSPPYFCHPKYIKDPKLVKQEDCIYYLWFEYLRRSSKYFAACKNGGKGMEELYADFGDVFKDTFDEWFSDEISGVVRGEYLFAYPHVTALREITNDKQFGVVDLQKYFVFVIDKFANKKNTLKILSDIWKSKVTTNKVGFKRARYIPRSNTHNIHSLKEYLKIYDAKLLGLKHWECVATARGLEFDTVIKEDREYFNIIASKALKKAKKLIALTEQGQFI